MYQVYVKYIYTDLYAYVNVNHTQAPNNTVVPCGIKLDR